MAEAEIAKKLSEISEALCKAAEETEKEELAKTAQSQDPVILDSGKVMDFLTFFARS